MLGKIVYISNNTAHIAISPGVNISSNLMNMHIIFEDEKKKVLGEIDDISPQLIKVRFLGEIINNTFIGGVIRKPTTNANTRMINDEELKILVGEKNPESFMLGTSALYDNYPVNMNINDLFSHHTAIFGNSGSGKSCGVARILQNVFSNPNLILYRANIFIFDTYGEYHNAFTNFNSINPNYQFKYYNARGSIFVVDGLTPTDAAKANGATNIVNNMKTVLQRPGMFYGLNFVNGVCTNLLYNFNINPN